MIHTFKRKKITIIYKRKEIILILINHFPFPSTKSFLKLFHQIRTSIVVHKFLNNVVNHIVNFPIFFYFMQWNCGIWFSVPLVLHILTHLLFPLALRLEHVNAKFANQGTGEMCSLLDIDVTNMKEKSNFCRPKISL